MHDVDSSVKLNLERRESIVNLKKHFATIKYDKKTICSTEVIFRMNAKFNSHRSSNHQDKINFFLSPPEYDAFEKTNSSRPIRNLADIATSKAEGNPESVYAWSKKEIARRKVATWLQTNC